MIGGSQHERALVACLTETPDLRLVAVKKTLSAIEAGEVKGTHRLATVLRQAIDSVSKTATDAGLIQTCAAYVSRVRAIDPRSAAKNDAARAAFAKPTPHRPKFDQDAWKAKLIEDAARNEDDPNYVENFWADIDARP